MGARAVLVGRPVLYGIAVGGTDGASRVLEMLRREIDQTLALLGCTSIADLEPSMLAATAAFGAPTWVQSNDRRGG